MPQFDLFIWLSLSYWTTSLFHIFYVLLTYYILPPFSNLQKTLIKLYNLKNSNKANILPFFSFFEYFVKFYLQNKK